MLTKMDGHCHELVTIKVVSNPRLIGSPKYQAFAPRAVIDRIFECPRSAEHPMGLARVK